MEVTARTVFTVAKGERNYEFFVPAGAPYGEALDACYETLAKIAQMQQVMIENSKPTTDVQEPAS